MGTAPGIVFDVFLEQGAVRPREDPRHLRTDVVGVGPSGGDVSLERFREDAVLRVIRVCEDGLRRTAPCLVCYRRKAVGVVIGIGVLLRQGRRARHRMGDRAGCCLVGERIRHRLRVVSAAQVRGDGLHRPSLRIVVNGFPHPRTASRHAENPPRRQPVGVHGGARGREQRPVGKPGPGEEGVAVIVRGFQQRRTGQGELGRRIAAAAKSGR